MNIDNKVIWQIAGVDNERSYVDVFLRWDVVAMGPGRHGKWPECKVEELLADGHSSRMVSCLRRFHEEVKDGNIVVLRLGTNQVYGVGEVVGDETLWLDEFGDIDGWDLEHVRRVKWFWKYDTKPMQFSTYSLKWGDTVQRMTAPGVIDWIKTLPTDNTARSLTSLPTSCVDGRMVRPSDMQEVADFLFDEGIAAKSIDDVVEQIDDLVRIARWYNRSGQKPSEQETIAYLVVPLLRTLGWTPQRMSVQWNYLDAALFSRTPRTDAHLKAVVEVKKLGESCWTARPQAEGYALKPGRGACRQLIVTDGLRYAVYLRDTDKQHFHSKPLAYLNLTRMRDKYPILECEGTRAALLTMASDWNGETVFLQNMAVSDEISNLKGEIRIMRQRLQGGKELALPRSEPLTDLGDSTDSAPKSIERTPD